MLRLDESVLAVNTLGKADIRGIDIGVRLITPETCRDMLLNWYKTHQRAIGRFVA